MWGTPSPNETSPFHSVPQGCLVPSFAVPQVAKTAPFRMGALPGFSPSSFMQQPAEISSFPPLSSFPATRQLAQTAVPSIFNVFFVPQHITKNYGPGFFSPSPCKYWRSMAAIFLYELLRPGALPFALQPNFPPEASGEQFRPSRRSSSQLGPPKKKKPFGNSVVGKGSTAGKNNSAPVKSRPFAQNRHAHFRRPENFAPIFSRWHDAEFTLRRWRRWKFQIRKKRSATKKFLPTGRIAWCAFSRQRESAPE